MRYILLLQTRNPDGVGWNWHMRKQTVKESLFNFQNCTSFAGTFRLSNPWNFSTWLVRPFCMWTFEHFQLKKDPWICFLTFDFVHSKWSAFILAARTTDFQPSNPAQIPLQRRKEIFGESDELVLLARHTSLGSIAREKWIPAMNPKQL